MSRNEHVDGMVLSGLTNLKCSVGVDQISADISASENLTWSNSRFLSFSNPNLDSTKISFAANPSSVLLNDHEKSGFNSSPILLNAFDSTGMPADTPSIAGSSFVSIPMTELSACGLRYRSKASVSLLPIPVSSTSCTGEDSEKVQHITSHEPLNPHLNRQTSTRNSFRKDKDPLESTDILQEAIQILHSLSFDISRSLDDIPKSIALPSVIDKYSRRMTEKSVPQENPSSSQNAKVGDISTFISPCEEILQLLAELQCRCLEYREATLDIAESIIKEYRSDDFGVMKDLIARHDGLRDDFTNFKKLCFRAKGARTGAESLSSLITDCLQTSYLRLLVEENETFLVRLKFGIYMVRVNARLMRDLKEASIRVQMLEEEVDYITRTTIGYRV